MTDDARPSHQAIEEAFKPASEMLERLPENTESRSAKRNLKTAEEYAHEVRDRMSRPNDDE